MPVWRTGWSYMFRLISLTPCQTAMFKFYTNLQNIRGIVTYPCHPQDVTNTPVRIALFLITIKYIPFNWGYSIVVTKMTRWILQKSQKFVSSQEEKRGNFLCPPLFVKVKLNTCSHWPPPCLSLTIYLTSTLQQLLVYILCWKPGCKLKYCGSRRWMMLIPINFPQLQRSGSTSVKTGQSETDWK